MLIDFNLNLSTIKQMKEPLTQPLNSPPANYSLLLNNNLVKRFRQIKTGKTSLNNLCMGTFESSPAIPFSQFTDKIPQVEITFPAGNSQNLQIMASMCHFSTF